jgi:beta-glucosidase
VADDFYHRYASDIDLMHQMNIPAYRFSLSWPRIMPNGTGAVNQKGIDFYNRVIDKCLSVGIEPWVTCYHWDMPQVLEAKGGWANRDMVKWFEDYVAVCGKAFGDRVKNWMVINEPMSFAVGGYLFGIHPPGGFSLKRFYKAVHYITMGQAAGGRALRATVKDGNIGTTFSCMPIDGWKDKPKNLEAAKRVDVLANRLFIEPALGMGYPVKDLPALRHVEKHILPGDADLMKFDFDFIGLQNYTRWVVKKFAILPMVHAINIKPSKMGHDLTEMGWEVYPEGIYRIIKQFAAYKGVKKIILTENGVAVKDQVVNGQIDDPKRTQYIKDYLGYVLKAKREGINVGGYFIWSFMDNFEWAEGYRPKLGIVGVDFKTQQRIIKSSGKWYADFLGGR